MNKTTLVKSKLNDLYKPIANELNGVDKNIQKVISKINTYSDDFKYVKEISNYFFSVAGKKLRPTLVITSAYAANNGRLSESQVKNILIFATVIELIHSASLVHDDILDEDVVRRGQQALNSRYGTKSALLFGDMVYAEAFIQLSRLDMKDDTMKNEIIRRVSDMSRDMCVGEIEALRYNNIFTEEQYISVIEKKTAGLTAVSCGYPVMLLGKDDKTVKAFTDYGYNIGMLYQLIDDFIDDNVTVENFDFPKLIDLYAEKAESSLHEFETTDYLENLNNFIKYIKRKKQ